MISAAAQFIGCLVMMFVTEWRMALAAITVTLLGFLVMALVMMRSQKYFAARQKNLGELNGYIEEVYSATMWCVSPEPIARLKQPLAL